MEKENQILFDDPSSARYLTNIKGWVDIDNRYFGDNGDSEKLARYSSCTHTRCECGKLAKRGWLKCDDCRELLEIEKYNNFEFKEYDGSLVYSHLLDMYFNDSEEIEDYCLDEDIEHKDLRLVYCDPIYFREVETDYWSDNLPDDNDEYIIPNELQTALDNLNKVISGLSPISYYPGKIRTEYIVI